MRLGSAVGMLLLIATAAFAKQLRPQTAAAFEEYVRLSEQHMADEVNSGSFFWVDTLPVAQRDGYYARLRKGEVVVQQLQTLREGGRINVPDGLIHHWIGVVFIPGANLTSTLAFLQDYDDQHKFYGPEVERSRLISRNGNDFEVYLRLRQKKVVTVVLNTEYEVHYAILGNDRASARSYSIRVAEIHHAGEADESEKPVGEDDGFLWRLNSYWRFWQRDGGTYVQLEAISLTRDIPAGLGWLVRPFVSSVPRESLAFTLGRTRSALLALAINGGGPGTVSRRELGKNAFSPNQALAREAPSRADR